MLLATYQPYVLMPEHRNDQYECFRGKLDGEYPVFCFPARSADEFRFRSLLAAPVKPERLILIDTDEYARFDAVEWNRILCLPRDDAAFRERFERMFDGVDERFSEYVVKPHELDSSVDEVDIKRLIEEEDFAFVEEKAIAKCCWLRRRALGQWSKTVLNPVKAIMREISIFHQW